MARRDIMANLLRHLLDEVMASFLNEDVVFEVLVEVD